MDESRKSQSSGDEIDLGKLFEKIGEGFRNAGNSFVRLLALIRRTPLENKLSFTVIILVSVGVGVVFSSFLNKNFYESTMILSSEYLNKRLAESTVEKLSLLAREQNKRGLAQTLNLPDSLADNIVDFKVRPFVDENDIVELEVLKEQLRSAGANAKNEAVIAQVVERIEIENRHAFEITVRTLSPSIIPNLQNTIFNYFRDNTYIRKRIETRKRNLLDKERQLIKDVARLDSLKAAIEKTYLSMADKARSGSNNVFLNDQPGSGPVEVYATGLNLYNELEGVKENIALQSDFELVDGFTEFSEPASMSTLKMMIYSFLIGIVIAYIDVALRSLNRYLSNVR